MSDNTKRIFVNYRNFEAADFGAFKKLDPTPGDDALSVEDWQKIPAIHYQDLYNIIGKYQEITRLGRFSHPQLLLVPDGRTLLLSAQHYVTMQDETPFEYSVIRDPYGNSIGSFLHGADPLIICFPSINLGGNLFTPGLDRFRVQFTQSLTGKEEITGRIVENRINIKEPTDYYPPVWWRIGLYVEPERKGTRLTLTNAGNDPAEQTKDKFGNYIEIKEDKKNKTTKVTILIPPKRSRKPVGEKGEETSSISVDLSSWLPQVGVITDVAQQTVQRPRAFIGPNGVYAVYSHFAEKRWRQIGHSLPKIEKELAEIERQFGLEVGLSIDSVLFQDSNEVNASVHLEDTRTIRINDKMLDSFGNADKTAWHEVAHVLDFHFGICNDRRWVDLHEIIGRNNPNFFLFLAETYFLPTVGGHPQDNPAEFFASFISSLTHPDILEYFGQRAQLKPDREYVVTYLKTLECLQKILGEKLSPAATILKQLEDLRQKVESIE